MLFRLKFYFVAGGVGGNSCARQDGALKCYMAVGVKICRAAFSRFVLNSSALRPYWWMKHRKFFDRSVLKQRAVRARTMLNLNTRPSGYKSGRES